METTEVKATQVNAQFETVGKYENVLIYFPGKNDKFLKFIPAHEIQVPNLEKSVKVPAHFRRGDIIDGKFVTKHFFVDKKFQGSNIIATIEVVSKIDHARQDNHTIILNITLPPTVARANQPEWKIKIGTDKVPEDNGFKIPGTKKFITFQKI